MYTKVDRKSMYCANTYTCTYININVYNLVKGNISMSH